MNWGLIQRSSVTCVFLVQRLHLCFLHKRYSSRFKWSPLSGIVELDVGRINERGGVGREGGGDRVG